MSSGREERHDGRDGRRARAGRLQPQLPGDGLGHVRARFQRCQPDQPDVARDARPRAVGDRPGDLAGERGLADAAGAGEGHEPGGPQLLQYAVDVVAPADHLGQPPRQPGVARERLARPVRLMVGAAGTRDRDLLAQDRLGEGLQLGEGSMPSSSASRPRSRW